LSNRGLPPRVGVRQVKRDRSQTLPPNLPPRGLNREQAAAYVGVGPDKFDEMVRDGRMPQPKRVDKRVIWDLHEVDKAFDALGTSNAPGNPWHTVKVTKL